MSVTPSGEGDVMVKMKVVMVKVKMVEVVVVW